MGYPALGAGDAAALSAGLAVGFVREDRRSLIGLGVQDRDAYVSSSLALGELGKGRPESSIVRVIAVRGERLAVACGRVQFSDDSVMDSLIVIQFDKDEWLVERLVIFDPDQEQAAIVELDRLYGDLNAQAG